MNCNAIQNQAPANAVSRREARTFVPTVDIIETAEEVRLLADVPGADPAGIEVQYDRGRLTLFAPVTPRHEGNSWRLREYGVGDYERSFEVGEQIDPDGIRAELAEGVLTLHLPKLDRAKTRRIEVKPQ